MATKTAVAKAEEQKLPQTQEEDYADRYSGEGTVKNIDPSKLIIPQVRILQGQSPQVKKNNVNYVEGAEPGMIFLSASVPPLVSGDEGILFQPCAFQSRWEVRTTKEKGGGIAQFVDIVADPDPSWKKTRDEKNKYVFYKTSDGNEAREIDIHIGLVHMGRDRLPYAIRFAGTGMFISKNFNGLIVGRRTSSGIQAPSFAYLYRFKVKTQSNNVGEWGQWQISPAAKAENDDIELGHNLFLDFEKKGMGVEQSQEDFSPAEPRSEQDPL